MKQTNEKRFKKIKTNLILAFIIVFTFIGVYHLSNNECSATPIMKYQGIENVNYQRFEIIEDTTQLKKKLENDIINEVTKYINGITPKAHKFIPKYIVQAGLKYDIDICFMVAQTQIETTFGTAGAGREISRRSLFGVAIKRYSNYDTAINDYCELLKKSYLVKGKTEKHLMTKYVTAKGARYAGNPNYERELTKTYTYIKNHTNIYSLQQEYKKM